MEGTRDSPGTSLHLPAHLKMKLGLYPLWAIPHHRHLSPLQYYEVDEVPFSSTFSPDQLIDPTESQLWSVFSPFTYAILLGYTLRGEEYVHRQCLPSVGRAASYIWRQYPAPIFLTFECLGPYSSSLFSQAAILHFPLPLPLSLQSSYLSHRHTCHFRARFDAHLFFSYHEQDLFLTSLWRLATNTIESHQDGRICTYSKPLRLSSRIIQKRSTVFPDCTRVTLSYDTRLERMAHRHEDPPNLPHPAVTMKCFLDILPVEMTDNIAKFLPTRDANNLARTCWAAYHRVDHHVWKDHVPTPTKPGPITWGVVTKQMRVIEKAVETGANVNAPDWLACFRIPERYDNGPEGWSLAKGASMNANGSPLHFAALTNNLEAAQYLLQHGATFHNTGLDDWALNMCSCHRVDDTWHWPRDNERWDEEDEEDKYFSDYFTLPLHTALCHKSLEVAKLFLEHGASVRDHGSHRYEVEAAPRPNDPYQYNDFLHVFVEKGPDYLAVIDLIAQCPDIDIDGMERTFATPIHVACTKPHNAAVITKLAEYGAMEDWTNVSQHWMHCCLRSGMYDNALALLKAGLHASNPEVTSVIRSDARQIFIHATGFETPLEVCHMAQVMEIIRVLVQDYGLELNASLWGEMSNCEDTPLEHLIDIDSMPEYWIQILVDLGARLDLRDRNGHIPLVSFLWQEKSIIRFHQMKTKQDIDEGESSSNTKPKTRPIPAIRMRLLGALIEACCWANISLDEKYSWGQEQLTLRQILERRFTKPKSAGYFENNRGLWKYLHAKAMLTLDEEQDEEQSGLYRALNSESDGNLVSVSDENSASE
ncbi:ankyrin repeat-containing domain protein [Sordaria brevicollis]|uniref:Ankyrin repeat-containing domain protein n=1 Tax=Sordaria brevicollis TaxID=83679 RepID=A0AAE0PP03_SORBR|nr:ankyrin repeat-containing domain protein [Sordaria brevicollis]